MAYCKRCFLQINQSIEADYKRICLSACDYSCECCGFPRRLVLTAALKRKVRGFLFTRFEMNDIVQILGIVLYVEDVIFTDLPFAPRHVEKLYNVSCRILACQCGEIPRVRDFSKKQLRKLQYILDRFVTTVPIEIQSKYILHPRSLHSLSAKAYAAIN